MEMARRRRKCLDSKVRKEKEMGGLGGGGVI